MNYQEFINLLKKPQNYVLTRYFKSFLNEFNKKEWKRAQHYRIIDDFVKFIVKKSVEVLQLQQQQKSSSDGGFLSAHSINTTELERNWKQLVEQKLYDKIFGMADEQKVDEKLRQKCSVLSQFLKLEHFTTAKISVTASILQLISSEFGHMSLCKCSAEKLVHVVNGCKLLLSFLSTTSVDLISFDEGSEGPMPTTPATSTTITIDEYLPVLIYIIITKYPAGLHLNLAFLEHIAPEVGGESAYYFTNLLSATHYIQNLDGSTLHCDIDWYWSQFAQYLPAPPSPPPLPSTRRLSFAASLASTGSNASTSKNHRDSSSSFVEGPSTISSVFGFLSKYVPSSASLTSNPTAGTSSPSPARPAAPSRSTATSIFTRQNSNIPAMSAATFNTPLSPNSLAQDEEEYQLQLALALSLSEQEHEMYMLATKDDEDE